MASETASDLAFPPQDLAQAAARDERARTVSDELEAIFGEPPPATERKAKAARVARTPLGRGDGSRRRLSAASLGALGAAALAGLAAGTLLVKAPAKHIEKTHPAALPIEMVPPPQVPQAADAVLAEPAPPSQVIAAAPPPQSHAVSQATAHAVRHKTRPRSGGYEGLRAADRRLRSAYAEAIRAGAPRSLILEDRARWDSLRRRERENPDRLAAAYRDLAHHLDRAAEQARRREARAGRRSFFHPRFAPWWG